MKITIVCDVLGEANNGTSLAAYNLINTLINKNQTHLSQLILSFHWNNR